MFQNNVFDLYASSNITMINNGTDDCVSTLINPYSQEDIKVQLDNFWTTSDEIPVKIYQPDDTTTSIIAFTRNDKNIPPVVLEFPVYKLILPQGKSLMITSTVFK